MRFAQVLVVLIACGPEPVSVGPTEQGAALEMSPNVENDRQAVDGLGISVEIPPGYSIFNRGGAVWISMNSARSVRLDTQSTADPLEREIRRLPRGAEVTEQGELSTGGFFFRWERLVGNTSIRGHHAFSLVPTPGQEHAAVTCSGTQRGQPEALDELLAICQSVVAVP